MVNFMMTSVQTLFRGVLVKEVQIRGHAQGWRYPMAPGPERKCLRIRRGLDGQPLGTISADYVQFSLWKRFVDIRLPLK
jgi:hypothetical protein